MGLTQLEEIAEGYEAVINNNVDGVPVVSKKPITPFTTALKMLRAQQRSTVSTNVGTSYTNCTVHMNVYHGEKEKED